MLSPVTGRTLATSILIGSCALLVLGVQPVLLGAMVQEGRIAEAQVAENERLEREAAYDNPDPDTGADA